MIGLGKSALSFRTRIRGMRSRRGWRAAYSDASRRGGARQECTSTALVQSAYALFRASKRYEVLRATAAKMAALQNAMSDEPAGVRLHPGSKGLPGRCAGNGHTYHLRGNQESAAKGCGGIEFMS